MANDKLKTCYKIYKAICNDLGILFPLRESELVVRQNPIPNNLEFYKSPISKEDLHKCLDDISKTYYKIFQEIGEDNFYNLHESNEIFNEHPREYPDRNINISTVISILYVSGFRDNILYEKAKKYLVKERNITWWIIYL